MNTRKYYWDGKKVWWGVDGQEYNAFPVHRMRLHLLSEGFKDWKAQIEVIKREFAIDGAWPIALHSAGDLIKRDGKTFLCTDTILPPTEVEGDFPFIEKIFTGMLRKRADEFMAWLAHAVAYAEGKTDNPPAILCLIGDCNSQKGLLAEVASIALSGRWHPKKILFRTDSISSGRFENQCDIAWILHLSDCRPGRQFEQKLRNFLELLHVGKRFEGIELSVRRIPIIRCHNAHWEILEGIVRRHAKQGIQVFRVHSGFHLEEGDGWMNSQQIAEKVRAETPQLRFRLSNAGAYQAAPVNNEPEG